MGKGMGLGSLGVIILKYISWTWHVAYIIIKIFLVQHAATSQVIDSVRDNVGVLGDGPKL